MTERLERLNLEPSWAGHGVRSERFGQVGSMPVNKWFPWLLVEDVKNHVFGARSSGITLPGRWRCTGRMTALPSAEALRITSLDIGPKR